MPNVYIYGLFDSAKAAFLYVGQTANLKKRLTEHRTNKRKPRIWDLFHNGTEPSMIPLDAVPKEQAIDAEAKLIQAFARVNHPLLNLAYREVGHGFRERERIKRKKQRWIARLQKMPALERQALLSAMADSGITGDAESKSG
jgi:predicted GIY-YIG superfamily endonuclease